MNLIFSNTIKYDNYVYDVGAKNIDMRKWLYLFNRRNHIVYTYGEAPSVTNHNKTRL